MSCSPNNNDFQIFPNKGQLHKNLNLDLETLLRRIRGNDAIVYKYVITSVKKNEGAFVQKGSGPNFQGDFITLCTCKPLMRCYKDIRSGTWIAGFSSVKASNGKQALFYLMKIQQTFESHEDLWSDKKIPEKTKLAKAAHRHKCGDLYKPKIWNRDRFNPENYEPPREGHSHKADNHWHKDIHYPDYLKRISKLLIGDQQLSFLWTRPILFSEMIQSRAQKKYDNIQDFLSSESIYQGVC